MPLIKREILPVSLSRCPVKWGVTETGEEVTYHGDYDLTAVTNVTLCGALQQLASIMLAADSIHRDLLKELEGIHLRTQELNARISILDDEVSSHNPKTVSVPESDIWSFSKIETHFVSRCSGAVADSSSPHQELQLFSKCNRPVDIERMYGEALLVPACFQETVGGTLDRADDPRASRYVMCKAGLGDSLKKEKLEKLNLDIETRRPASFVALRDWCSDDETLVGELALSPVPPSWPTEAPSGPLSPRSKLPLPEQLLEALRVKYPPQTVQIDVSGKGFRRMEIFRQSLLQYDYVKGRRRRRRLKRRNTIADARDARTTCKGGILGLPSTSSGPSTSLSYGCSTTDRSLDTTIDTSSTKTSCERELHPPHLGLDVSLPTPPKNAVSFARHLSRDCNTFRDDVSSLCMSNDVMSSNLDHSSPRERRRRERKAEMREEIKGNGVANMNGKQCKLIRNAKLFTNSSLPISTNSTPMNLAIKFREGSSREEGTRSSSGNWSGSSSPRTSLESDLNHQHLIDLKEVERNQFFETPQPPLKNNEEQSYVSFQDDVSPKSAKLAEPEEFDCSVPDDASTSSVEPESFVSENYQSTSQTTDYFPSASSYTSDGTLTPTQDIQDIPFFDDDTSSAFSCDTEGYYTSFHIDSGLRSVSYEGNKLASDSDADVYTRASTGTTNSSASLGTVIMRNPEKKTPPKPPQRVSSLERKERDNQNRESIITVIHLNGSTSSREDVGGSETSETDLRDRDSKCSKDGDSGRDTASSPTTSPKHAVFSPEPRNTHEEVEARRKENFRLKTTISTSGIPSMCVITPPQSDDESRSGNFKPVKSALASGELPKIQPRNISNQQYSSSSNKSVNFSAPTSMRQPGDGAVAPSVPSTSPSYSHIKLYTPTLTVNKREGELNAQLKSVATAEKTVKDHYSLGKPVAERRAEIQSKVLGERKPPPDVHAQRQTSKENSRKDSKETTGKSEDSNIVSFKEMPSLTSGSHPFSAVPANVKQNVVITPTNSLERRKAASKTGARVTLDSEGKVVYSSDSLPRRKGHTSFEPGPYIKPQPISTSNGTNVRGRAPNQPSSIQSMPLPPVPSGSAKEPSNNSTHSTTTPQQPKLGTRTQISAISQTLSGLSSVMQPRTISQINSIRSQNRGQKSSNTQDNVEENERSHVTKLPVLENQSQDVQQQNTEGKQKNSSNHSVSKKDTKNSEVSKQANADKSQQDQSLKQLQEQQALLYQRQLQQQALVKQQQQQQSLYATQQQMQHQQMLLQQKHEIEQTYQMQQQQLLEQQKQALSRSPAPVSQPETIYQTRKDAQSSVKPADNIYQTRQEAQRQQLLQLQQQQQHLAALQHHQTIIQAQPEVYMSRQALLQQQHQQLQEQHQQQQQQLHFLKQQREQQQLQQQAAQSGSQSRTPDLIAATTIPRASPYMLQGQVSSSNSLVQGVPQTNSQVDPNSNSRPISAPTTSRAPTPIQGIGNTGPNQFTTTPPNLVSHPNLRTNSGILNNTSISSRSSDLNPSRISPLYSPSSPVSVSSFSGHSDNLSLDPSTDRVFLALAHARLATASLKNIRQFKSNDSAITESSNTSKCSESGLNDSQNSFQRTHSYKLATSLNLEVVKDNECSPVIPVVLKQNDACSSPFKDIPMINERPLFGPRMLNNYDGNRRSPVRINTLGTYPGSLKNTNPPPDLGHSLRRKRYGTSVKVNPNLIRDVKKPRDGRACKENRVKSHLSIYSPPKFVNCEADKPRVVGVVRKPDSPCHDTEIW